MNAIKYGLLALSAGLLALVAYAPSAQAQNMINPKAKEKVRWYNAPREIQIIDDRPIIKDFREAPARPQPGIQLPPGPGAGAGFGAGAAGGMGDPGFRTSAPSLPRADFGAQPSNIPARGMAPAGMLPSGQSTGVHTKPQQFKQTNSGPVPRAMPTSTRAAAPVASSAPPTVASYGGGYGASSGGSRSSSSSSTSVHGKLLNRIK